MYWLVAFVVLLIIEIITVGLTTIWFAMGAIAAFIAAILGADIWIQVFVFLIISLGALFLLRPFALKFLNQDRIKTNVDSLIGKNAIVTTTIVNDQSQGTVKVAGQEWTARSSKDSITLQKDSKVRILEVKGVKLIVEEVKED